MGTYIIIGIIAFVLGAIIMYLILSYNSVKRSKYDNLQNQLNESNNQTKIKDGLLKETKNDLEISKSEIELIRTNYLEAEKKLAATTNELKSSQVKINEMKELLNSKDNSILQQTSHIKQLENTNTEFKYDNENLNEKLRNLKLEIDELQKKALLEFESIANRIFEEKTSRFSKLSKDNLDQVLNPLKDNLNDFKKKVEETYEKESKERFRLEDHIKNLADVTNKVNIEATNLTNALKGQVKTQGNWGEMILESILEYSGLQEGVEYFSQNSFNDEGIRKQPDIIIKLPGKRVLIIDSKVSLTAYERFANEDDKELQKNYLNQHTKSLRSHIDNLYSKNYENQLDTLDFVMLFIPIEPAYITAINHDKDIWHYAYKKRIILISPTNLIAVIKLISDLWKREHQNNNALEIADRGAKLYDKFVGFINDMENVEKSLEKASTSFTSAFNKLYKGRGNLVSQTENLKQLGLNTKKEMSEKFTINNDQIESNYKIDSE
jgi:DNA recombination protein RmuC